MKIVYVLAILLSLYVFILTLTMSFFYYFNRSINEEYSRSQDVFVGIGVIWILIGMILLTYRFGKQLTK
jgi:hypothetical protein